MAQLVVVNGSKVATILTEVAVFIEIAAVGLRFGFVLLARGIIRHKVAKVCHLVCIGDLVVCVLP